MKRIFRGFVTAMLLCLVIALVPQKVSAAQWIEGGKCCDGVYWTVYEDGLLKLEGSGDMPDYTTGTAPWDKYRYNITKIEIKNYISSIGNNAFWRCENLTSVSITSPVVSIGHDAFSNCQKLKTITLPEGVQTIGNRAFEFCTSLQSIVLPDTLTSIGDYAFNSCWDLESIDLPPKATGLGANVFANCGSLTSIALPENLTVIGESMFEACYTLTSVEIPNAVTTIGNRAFYGTNLTSVEIPQSVETIGAYAFYECPLKTVTIPGSVASIGSYAFCKCGSLEEVVLQDGVKSIGDYVFQKCTALTTVSMPDSVSHIGSYTFGSCSKLKDIHIPNSLASFYAGLFYDCDALTSLVLPESISYLHSNSLSNCDGLTTVKFTGDAPSADLLVFASTSAYAQYPGNNPTWTKAARDEIASGSVIWQPYYTAEIKTQPKNAYAKSGASAKVTFEAVGDGLEYTWYYKDPGKTKFSKSTTTGAVYKLPMNEARSGRQVYCKIKDKYGNTAKTDTVYLRMSATVTTQPTDAFAKSGSYAKLSVSAIGDGLKYEWYFKDPGKTSYTKSTTTGTTYKLMMNEARNGRRVYCKITDKYKKYVKTDVVTLHMSATITTQPKNVTVASGSKAKVKVGAVGDGLRYVWYYKDPGKTKFTKSTVTGSEYSVTMNASRNGRQVYCKVYDKYDKVAKSNTVTMKKK